MSFFCSLELKRGEVITIFEKGTNGCSGGLLFHAVELVHVCLIFLGILAETSAALYTNLRILEDFKDVCI